MARIARLIRSLGFGTLSVGLHLALVVMCLLLAAPATNLLAADRDWIEIDMPPALGQPHGQDDGKDLGSHVPEPDHPDPQDFEEPKLRSAPLVPPEPPEPPEPKMPDPEPFEPPSLPPPEPDAIPTAIPSVQPLTDAGVPLQRDVGGLEPVDAGAGAPGVVDPTTPVGSENVPPALGSPDGVPGGKGAGARAVSPQYLGILRAWANARFPSQGHGLGPAPEGPKPCALVTIQLSPGRQVTGSSMSSSGQAVWDDWVRGRMRAFDGATAPADPEGGPAPQAIPVSVCWL